MGRQAGSPPHFEDKWLLGSEEYFLFGFDYSIIHAVLIETYSAKALDSGMGRPSSIIPCTWSSRASRMFWSASSRVAPVATQPGRSGEYADQLPPAISIMTRNLLMLFGLFQSGLFHDAVQCAGR